MIATALGLFALGALVLHLASVVIVGVRLARAPAPGPGLLGRPPVTLLRPVCGVDPHDAETLRASFVQDYPEYEIVFCAPRGDDPAVALVERLIGEHPEARARLLVGETAGLRNPKLRNVEKGWRAARHGWVCMTDSNLMLPRDYLSIVTAAWRDGTGLVSGPPVGIRPQGWAGHLECAFLNTNQARLQLAVDTLGFGFAQGKTLFFNKPLIEGAGGLFALDRHLAEDVNATKIVRRLGLRVTVPAVPFAQPIGRRSWRQVWDRQVRWARVRREGFPTLFAVEPLNGALVPFLALGAHGALTGSPGWTLAAYALAWYGAEAALAWRARWPASLRDLAMLPLRDLLLPAIWGAAMLRQDFEWRGNRLASAETPAPQP